MTRRSLAAPFAVLGAAGGWLTLDAFGLAPGAGHHEHLHGIVGDRETVVQAVLLLTTPLVAGLVGRWVSSPRSKDHAFRFVVSTVGGGILNGGLVGACAFPLFGAIPGAVYGGLVSWAFMPFLVPAYVAARLARARPGSLLASVERRTVWAVTLVSVAAGVLFESWGAVARPEPTAGSVGELAMLVAAFAGCALIALADGLALRRAGSLAAHPLVPRSSREAERTIDVGVGDAHWEEAEGVTGAPTYRERERVARVYSGDPRRAHAAVRVRFLLSVAFASSACAALLFFASRRPPAPRIDVFPVPASTDPAPAPPERVRSLYAQDWRGGATLVGVDRAGSRAFVALDAHEPPAYALDVIDLGSGRRVEHWEAPAEVAYRRAHWVSLTPPPAPSPAMLDEERAHAVAFVRALAPRPTTWFGLDPVLALSPDGASLVWNEAPKDGHDGDFLFLGDTDGGHARRVGGGQRASYAPVFSPDGSRLAWHGCGTPCSTGYALYVADAHGDLRGDRVAAVAYPKEPVWSADGRWIYAVATPNGAHDDPRSCVWRVAAAAPHEATRLTCSTELEDMTFAEDPTGATGLVAGSLGQPPAVTSVLRWIDLPSGRTKRAMTLDGGARFFVLDASGLALTGDAVVDLATGERSVIEDAASTRRWISPYGAAWTTDGRALALRTGSTGFEIVAIDARGVLADAKSR